MKLTPLAQDEAWTRLKTLSRHLPQSLILLGPSGVGKRRTAKALFQLMHCTGAAGTSDDGGLSLFGAPAEPAEPVMADEPCGECAACRKIAENRHSDWIEISPKGDNIAVDDLREMKKTLYFPPLDGPVRFVIIDEAHKLNAASANTLLKTLEEPPAHTRFFLITHERGLLLPTIISRSQFIYFTPLDRDALSTLLAQMQIELPDNLRPLCLDLLGGGLSKAAQFSDEKVLNFLQEADRELRTGTSDAWARVVSLAEELGSDEWRLELFLDILVRFAHQAAIHATDRAGAFQASNLALEAVFLRRRLERHANKKLVALAAANLALAKS